MAGEQESKNPEIWILDRDHATQGELGTKLRAAAVRVWPRVEAYARKELYRSPLAGDDGLVREAWEQTLEAVLKALRRRFLFKPIRDLDSYLFVAFTHTLQEALRKERAVEFVSSNRELEALKEAQDWSWAEDLENCLQLKALVDRMEGWTKDVLYRWALDGDSWDEIAEDLGVTTNALKKRFFYRLSKIRAQAEKDKSSKI